MYIFVKMNKAVRHAQKADIPRIMTVLEAAKGIMRASGNMGQWVDGYPSEDVIADDIAGGYGFVVEEMEMPEEMGLVRGSAVIVGYFAYIPSPEPTYERIYEGAWLDDDLPYHVVHRIGSTPESNGVFEAIMAFCFSHDPNIRIDTHRDNRIMQHCILKAGFSYCGIIYLASGDERLAYQCCRHEKGLAGGYKLKNGRADTK